MENGDRKANPSLTDEHDDCTHWVGRMENNDEDSSRKESNPNQRLHQVTTTGHRRGGMGRKIQES